MSGADENSNAEKPAEMKEPTTVEEKVLYKVVGKVAYITLNNPKKRNAIDIPMVYRILDLLKQVDSDPKVKCLVINSTGDVVFSAGWDLAMFKEVNKKIIDDLLNVGATVSRTIFFMKKPVIVQIQGPAVGMGTIISLASDFRFVAKKEGLFFQLPELELGPGIPPATGPTVGAVMILGMAHAKDMLLTGRKVSLEEFNSWGAITQVVDPADDLGKVVKKFARKLSQKSGGLLNLTKNIINIMGLRIAKECWELENEIAEYYFNGMLGNETEEEGSFIDGLWAKYGKGRPQPL